MAEPVSATSHARHLAAPRATARRAANLLRDEPGWRAAGHPARGWLRGPTRCVQ